MKWEYKAMPIEAIVNLEEPAKLQQELNTYGKEGWELAGIFQQPEVGKGWIAQTAIEMAVFKRQIGV